MTDNMIKLRENSVPDIESINYGGNPTIVSPNAEHWISLRQTRETLGDIDTYISFIKSAVSLFRSSKVYKAYKAHLIDLGLDKCQYLSNLPTASPDDKKSPITIEMNHCILTIFDVALIICEHTLNTYGSIATPELVMILEEEHRDHRIPLVMMCKTVHQAYHSDPMFYVHPNLVFGKWWEFLQKYNTGITPDIAAKILFYINKSEEETSSTDNGLLQIVNQIQDWGCKNGGYINLDYSYNTGIEQYT